MGESFDSIEYKVKRCLQFHDFPFHMFVGVLGVARATESNPHCVAHAAVACRERRRITVSLTNDARSDT